LRAHGIMTIPNAAGPLAGIKVLDLTAVVVGPTCTLALAQQGADVIKLEPPEGDLLRRLGGKARTPGMAPKFLHFNRGKRSIVVDLKTDQGRAVARRLASGVDVFVSNMRAAALARLGLDWDGLRTGNPRLVHCTIAGFGATGSYRDLPAYDTIIQGVSGIAACMERSFGAPRYLPFVATDHMVGFIAAQAICAALVGRERSGRGQAIEVPMYENMAHFVLSEHMNQRTYGDDGPWGDPRIMDPNGRPARTKDGWICVSPNTDAQAFGFFAAIGRPELKEDPRFDSVAARLAHVTEYFELRGAALAEKTTAEWLALLRANQVPAMQVNRVEDLFTDPHLDEAGLIEWQDHRSEGRVRALASPNRFSEGLPPMRDAPLPGADGAAILAEFGYGAGDIAELGQGAVKLP
jgi:crotonobetainyl-CoA:carnitine CoA-transferase CaiB-like acyl-CoA transferase